jgi:hypothetical protein
LNIEQTRGFTLAQGEDEMFIAAKCGTRLQMQLRMMFDN